jgi:hypothetical protein
MHSGNRSGVTVNVAAVNFLHLDGPGPLPESEINRFLDLETIGITAHQDNLRDTKDLAVLQAFHASFRISDGRRVVSLPKKENITFSSNRKSAENRFNSLEARLQKNASLRHIYYTYMLDYIRRRQVEVVESDEELGDTFYLPHHAVSKGKRKTPNGESDLTHPYM